MDFANRWGSKWRVWRPLSWPGMILCVLARAGGNGRAPVKPEPADATTQAPAEDKRTELNLLGKTNVQAGEKPPQRIRTTGGRPRGVIQFTTQFPVLRCGQMSVRLPGAAALRRWLDIDLGDAICLTVQRNLRNPESRLPQAA